MDNDYKKTLLKQLISVAMGSAAGRGLQEIISGIKNAVAAYKNFSKEWDNINGVMTGGGAKTGTGTPKPTMNPMPKMPPQQMQPMQPMPNLQMPQNQMPPPGRLPDSMPPVSPRQEVRGRGWGEPGY